MANQTIPPFNSSRPRKPSVGNFCRSNQSLRSPFMRRRAPALMHEHPMPSRASCAGFHPAPTDFHGLCWFSEISSRRLHLSARAVLPDRSHHPDRLANRQTRRLLFCFQPPESVGTVPVVAVHRVSHWAPQVAMAKPIPGILLRPVPDSIRAQPNLPRPTLQLLSPAVLLFSCGGRSTPRRPTRLTGQTGQTDFPTQGFPQNDGNEKTPAVLRKTVNPPLPDSRFLTSQTPKTEYLTGQKTKT